METTQPPAPPTRNHWLLGLLGGALVGYLLRPSIPLIGQLPFPIVITRGLTLSGLDLMLLPAAEQSFNTMAACAAAGALLGIFLGKRGSAA